ncbi:MAG: cysteine synthase A [Kiritimatiellia bacterium]|jgi:cysteine synthase A
MEKIYGNVGELIGGTPLVRINKMNDGGAEIVAKLECFNPASSVKDRAALFMVDAAEREGKLKPGGLIVEPTSGNTGIGLALIAAIRGYKLVLTMPETMSVERQKILKAYGAAIVLTPGDLGMQGAVDKAVEIQAKTPGSFIPQQFDNPANAEAHRRTTAREILRDTGGRVDAFVACVGTGGTLSGTGEALKAEVPGVKVVAVEPDASPLLSGGKAGPHKIQGIGANFIPKNYNPAVVDQIETVSAEEAGETARRAATMEGLLIGISSGAALAVALRLGRKPEYEGKRIVALLPDSGERYLSTWLFGA